MKVAIIGATGFVGPKVVTEALNRGHEVTAFARNPEKLEVENSERLTKQSADVYDTDILANLLVGHDAVISTFNAGWTNPNLYNDFLTGAKSIQQAAKQAGVKRLIVVGGAGSLYIHGAQLVDGPHFPAEYKPGATAARDYLNELRKEEELDWTFLSPAINLHPGERTANFRLGTEEPVFNAEGKSDISAEDLAVALINELEEGQFIKKRFTLGY